MKSKIEIRHEAAKLAVKLPEPQSRTSTIALTGLNSI